jgi:hypothetical protein
MTKTYFAITTFGAPSRTYRKVHASLESALRQAARLKGTGSCTTVRVLEYATRALALDADISDARGVLSVVHV